MSTNGTSLSWAVDLFFFVFWTLGPWVYQMFAHWREQISVSWVFPSYLSFEDFCISELVFGWVLIPFCQQTATQQTVYLEKAGSESLARLKVTGGEETWYLNYVNWLYLFLRSGSSFLSNFFFSCVAAVHSIPRRQTTIWCQKNCTLLPIPNWEFFAERPA